MRRRDLLTLLTVIPGLWNGCSHFLLEPNQSRVLDAEHASQLVYHTPCNAKENERFQDVWELSTDDVAAMEANLASLQSMKAKAGGIIGASIEDMNDYYRQYVGIVSNGRKMIHINAFAVGDTPPVNWDETPVIICDGGHAAWTALYDIETGRFSELYFDGV